MTDDQGAKLMMYHRWLVFLTANLGDFAGTIVATLLAEFGQNIEDIHQAAAEQESGTGPVTARRGQRRDTARQVIRIRSQPLEVTLTATRSGNVVTGNVTLSQESEAGDSVMLRWREQGGPAIFTDGPVTPFPVGVTTTTTTATVSTANPVEVVARVIRADGRQIDSTAVVV